MKQITWVLESNVFPETHQALHASVCRNGHVLVDWSDTWWADGFPLNLSTNPIVFHGSLGNAASINDRLDWLPGSFFPTEAFRCSSWCNQAREWLVHSCWQIMSASDLVAEVRSIAKSLGLHDSIFGQCLISKRSAFPFGRRRTGRGQAPKNPIKPEPFDGTYSHMFRWINAKSYGTYKNKSAHRGWIQRRS